MSETEQKRRYRTILTDIGKEKAVRAAVSGEKVTVVSAAVGDGGGAYFEPTGDMTALRGERWRGAVAGMGINENSGNMLDVKVVVPGTVGGFTVRECGLFDDEGDLIAVCNLPDTEKVVMELGVAAALTILMHIVLADGDGLEFTVDPSVDSATVNRLALVIPADGWEQDGEEYRRDVPVDLVTALHIPLVALDREGTKTALECGLSSSVETLMGKIRFFADKPPEKEMNGTLTLLTQGGAAVGGESGTGESLLPATAFRLGGVKVGEGLAVTEDGILSVNAEKILTVDDLVDENEVKDSVTNILQKEE